MKQIKATNTKIEIKLRKALWHLGIRYRKNYRKLPGSPDIALTKYKIAIFCDSEFWHGYDWECKKNKIHSNREYWISKIERNIERDKEVDIDLIYLGWLPLHFWGWQINKDIDYCLQTILKYLPMQSFPKKC